MLNKRLFTKTGVSDRVILIYWVSLWILLIFTGLFMWVNNHNNADTIMFISSITFGVWVPTILLILTN